MCRCWKRSIEKKTWKRKATSLPWGKDFIENKEADNFLLYDNAQYRNGMVIGFFWSRSHYITQASFIFAILLPQSSEYWNSGVHHYAQHLMWFLERYRQRLQDFSMRNKSTTYYPKTAPQNRRHIAAILIKREHFLGLQFPMKASIVAVSP
jgi:hypothetical protein